MLAIDRHRKLLELLQKRGSVRTVEVARQLTVTEETVRRDFEKLEGEGLLLRSHGGAIRLDLQRREFPVKEREEQHAGAKANIARAALRHVQKGQTLYFDPSTTVQQLAKLLPDQPLTVVTNSLQIPALLADKPSVHVVLAGGELIASSLSCTGMAAEMTVDLYRIDAAFISCRGVEAKRGLSDAMRDQGRLKRHVIDRAEKTILLADHSKANVASSYFFSPLSSIDTWIVDQPLSGALNRALTTQRVKVEIADR